MQWCSVRRISLEQVSILDLTAGGEKQIVVKKIKQTHATKRISVIINAQSLQKEVDDTEKGGKTNKHILYRVYIIYFRSENMVKLKMHY